MKNCLGKIVALSEYKGKLQPRNVNQKANKCYVTRALCYWGVKTSAVFTIYIQEQMYSLNHSFKYIIILYYILSIFSENYE